MRSRALQGLVSALRVAGFQVGAMYEARSAGPSIPLRAQKACSSRAGNGLEFRKHELMELAAGAAAAAGSLFGLLAGYDSSRCSQLARLQSRELLLRWRAANQAHLSRRRGDVRLKEPCRAIDL